MKILLEGTELKAMLKETFPSLTKFRQNDFNFDFSKKTWRDHWVEFCCDGSEIILIIHKNKELAIKKPKDLFTQRLIKKKIEETMDK